MWMAQVPARRTPLARLCRSKAPARQGLFHDLVLRGHTRALHQVAVSRRSAAGQRYQALRNSLARAGSLQPGRMK